MGFQLRISTWDATVETTGLGTEVKVATWSPDGQLLAFVDPNEGVGVRDLNRSFRMLLERRVVSRLSLVGWLVGWCWLGFVGWVLLVGNGWQILLGFSRA